MSIIWVKSKFTADQLKHKRIEIFLPSGVPGYTERHLWVLDALLNRQTGFLAVDAVSTTSGTHSDPVSVGRLPLGQEAVDRMTVHPDPDVADFHLNMAT